MNAGKTQDSRKWESERRYDQLHVPEVFLDQRVDPRQEWQAQGRMTSWDTD